MPQEVEYPQITGVQYEIWAADPVTKCLLQCLEWRRLDSRDAAGTGELIDSSSADLTHALLHRSLGAQATYAELSDPSTTLEFYKMIKHPEKEVEDE